MKNALVLAHLGLFPHLLLFLTEIPKFAGRAEALLIAAYGKGLKKLNPSCILEDVLP